MRNNSKRFTRFGSANNAYHRVDFHAANTQHVESQWATTRRKIYHTREMHVLTQWIELSSSSTKWWDCWGEGKYYAVEREARVIVMRQKRLNEEKKTKAKVSVSSLPHLKTTTSWNKKKASNCRLSDLFHNRKTQPSTAELKHRAWRIWNCREGMRCCFVRCDFSFHENAGNEKILPEQKKLLCVVSQRPLPPSTNNSRRNIAWN